MIDLQRASLLAYLSEHLHVPASDFQIKPFKGGFSNLTFGIEAQGKKWVLRRPPLGKKISKAHDMVREFQFWKGCKGRVIRKSLDPFYVVKMKEFGMLHFLLWNMSKDPF